MPTLPAASSFTGSTVTEAQFKTAITDQREFLAGLLGTAGTQAAALTTLGAAGLGVSNTWTAQQAPMNGALTDGATITWATATTGQVASITLAGSRTMGAPSGVVRYALYLLRVTQDSTGSRTLAWSAAFKFGTSGAPTLTTTANKTDILSFVGGSANTLEYLGIRKDAV